MAAGRTSRIAKPAHRSASPTHAGLQGSAGHAGVVDAARESRSTGSPQAKDTQQLRPNGQALDAVSVQQTGRVSGCSTGQAGFGDSDESLGSWAPTVPLGAG